MTKSTTLAVPYVTPKFLDNIIITSMQALQIRSKSFLTTQGSETEIRVDKNILLIFTIIMLYYLISKQRNNPTAPQKDHSSLTLNIQELLIIT